MQVLSFLGILVGVATVQGFAIHEKVSQADKLREIRTLAKSNRPGSWVHRVPKHTFQNPEICFDNGCLQTAFDLLNAVNLSVDPCNDFFEFACGRWVRTNPVPSTSSRWSRFNRLREEVNEITSEILNEDIDINDPLPVNQVKVFYAACKDVDHLETIGLSPVRTLISDFGEWPMLNPSRWNSSSFDWLGSIGELRRRLLDDAVISVYVERDLKNTSRNVVFLDQPSFILPRSVLIDPSNYEQLILAYQTFIVEVAQELGTNESQASLEASARTVIDLEIQLANLTQSDEERYDVEAIYHPYTLNEFQAVTDSELPSFSVDWLKLLDQVFSTSGVTISNSEQLNVAGESYLLRALPIFQSSSSSRALADLIGFRVASSVITETTQAMRDITFKFTQALTGAREQQPRELVCAGSSNNNFGMAIGAKYIEAAFDTEAKDRVDEMVEHLRSSFKEMVVEAEWMENVTKEEALVKADAMESFMAFPDWLTNSTAIEEYYDGLELGSGPLIHFNNVLNLALWAGNNSLSNLREPTEKEWLTYPGVVNAFYSPQDNSITFPAGILQPPFFGKIRPMSQNYGGIGVVIGHEITHGFDNQGAQYDKDGNAINWWDDVTKEKYDNRTQCMVNQYNNFYLPSVDMYVNGELTLGENIADNGGVRESFRAYRHYIDELGREEGRLPGLENLTPDQLFFLGYANIWCEAITDEGLVNQLLTDPHSPARYRVIGPVRNNMDFAHAYACPVSEDGMNPPVDSKCTVW